MATIVMVMGESGSGKSTSLRNFKQGEISVINVSGKPLPFRSTGIAVKTTDNYQEIQNLIASSKSKTIVIDDATYLMTNEFMRTAKVTGFQKFTELALNFFNLVKFCAAQPADKIIYFMGHVDRDQNGNEHFKTIGKLLDEKITLEGLFTIVLKTVVQDRKYSFSTQTNGTDTVKSPYGMFESDLIPNDLKYVDTKIREFYNLTK